MGIARVGRTRIIDTFAARNISPGKKTTDVIVEHRAAQDGFKLEVGRRVHAKRKGKRI